MPIKVQNGLPTKELLRKENVALMEQDRAEHQDIRPLEILILNIMPKKQEAEKQLLRILSNTPLQINVEFMHMVSHVSKNTSMSYLNEYYNTFEDVKDKKFDGLIITGAPVENLPFEEVDYWGELTKIMEWSKTHVTSTLHICWGAQAGLYYHYDVEKILLKEKLFGIYKHRTLDNTTWLTRGFNDVFKIPQSRYTTINKEQVEKNKKLRILVESLEGEPVIMASKDFKNIFVTGHLEYGRSTLNKEYVRDVKKGLDIQIPKDYYSDDEPEKPAILSWRSTANTFFSNWIGFVYDKTPYDLNEIC